MLLSVLGVFSGAKVSTVMLRYTFKARFKSPPQQCFLDRRGSGERAEGSHEA